MKKIGDMKLYTLDETKDMLLGKVGTPERDEHERKVNEALHAYRIGEAIKKARLMQNLTQEELGERVGVQRAQISRIEKGYSISIPTMSRVFKALGIATATLDLGMAGKVTLW
jgi:DNA-binding XRE family transcriptional regulator